MCLLAYRLLTWIVLPYALLRLFFRCFKQRGYIHHWGERLAQGSYQPAQLWIHAVSLGESRLAIRLVREILRLCQKNNIAPPSVALSCTTPTGRDQLTQWITQQNQQQIQVFYKPFDCLLLQKRLLDKIKPSTLVCIETEIWPNMLRACQQRGITTLLANARLSISSANKQKRFLKLFQPVLAQLHVLAQDKNTLRRFVALGAKRNRVLLCGNCKFDIAINRDKGFERQLQKHSKPDKQGLRVVFGSIRRDESTSLLAAATTFLYRFPQHRIIWVPRHPEQDKELLERILKKTRLDWGWLKQKPSQQPCNHQLLLVGGYGKLGNCYQIADMVVMGGSFGAGGSHNIIEPGLLGKALVAGPSRHNFSFAYKTLSFRKAVAQTNAEQLPNELARLADREKERMRMAKAAKTALEQERGATSLQAERILLFLP